MKLKSIKQDQSGAVALITVILLMFIFLIVTLGFLRASISEQRNSTDSDLKSRAYYAAESGVEDAKRIIGRFYADGVLSADERNYLNGDTCEQASADVNVPGQLSSELNTEITCQLIDFEAGDYLTNLSVNESVFVPLISPNSTATSQVESVVIEWHETAVEGTVFSRGSSNVDIPNVGCWDSNENTTCDGDPYPAMLRVALTGHIQSGIVGRDNINNSSVLAYLNPVNGTGNVSKSAIENRVNINTPTNPFFTNNLSNSPECVANASSGYFCRVEITGLSGLTNYIRLTALYKGANVRLTMYNSLSEVLDFDNVQVKIDVTARAGDVYRRVETRVPLDSIDLLPDDAITTAEQLCKKVIIDSSTRATDECD